MPILILFAFCCNGIALILGIVGLIACTDEKARSKALLVTIIGAVVTVAGTGLRVMTNLGP